jgi:ubiquinone/menaquinone biosynthesis C-methylase UbiE
MAQERVAVDNVSIEDVERYRFASRYVRGKRVVDLACGTGYGANVLRENGAMIVHGFDVSDVALVAAKGTYRWPELQFAFGDAEKIPLPDASVDAVVSIETFEHVSAPERMLREFRRVLVPDGVLIVSTPRNETESRFRPDNPYHVREYSAAEFRAALEAVFRRVEMWSQLSDYVDDVPAVISSDRSLIGRAARAALPVPLRRWLRRSLGSRGLTVAGSAITEGENLQAGYQIAVCH